MIVDSIRATYESFARRRGAVIVLGLLGVIALWRCL